MPTIGIPPSLKNNIINNVNIKQPNSNIAQQIKDIAEQQSRMVLNDWLKNNKDLFEANKTKLTIQNIHTIVGQWYDNTYNIIGAKEWDTHYEFALGNDSKTHHHNILLHRRQTDSGHYIMEYNGKTLWLLRDEFDTIEKIIICMRTI